MPSKRRKPGRSATPPKRRAKSRLPTTESAAKKKAGKKERPPPPPPPPPPPGAVARRAPADAAARSHVLIARLLGDPAFQTTYRLARGAGVHTGIVFAALRTRPGYTYPRTAGAAKEAIGRPAAPGGSSAATSPTDQGWSKEKFKAALRSDAVLPTRRLVDWCGDRRSVRLTARGLEAFGAPKAKTMTMTTTTTTTPSGPPAGSPPSD